MSDIIEIGPLTFIQGENEGRYPFCNSIFIEQAGIIIDPSSNRKILKNIREKVHTVWLTHWHEDHIMHLDLFEGCPIQMHERDEPPLKNLNTFIEWDCINPEDNNPMAEHWKKLMVEQFHYVPRQAQSYLNDKDLIKLEDLTIEVIHVPGHTPGCLAFYFHEPQVAFLGDYDLTSFGPWYGDLYADIDQVIVSVNRLRKLPAETWLTGHGTGFFNENPGNAWDKYLAVIERREDKLYDFLKKPRTLDDIAEVWILYGKPKEPIDEFKFMEQINMKKHADRLISKGLISLDGKYYSRT